MQACQIAEDIRAQTGGIAAFAGENDFVAGRQRVEGNAYLKPQITPHRYGIFRVHGKSQQAEQRPTGWFLFGVVGVHQGEGKDLLPVLVHQRIGFDGFGISDSVLDSLLHLFDGGGIPNRNPVFQFIVLVVVSSFQRAQPG